MENPLVHMHKHKLVIVMRRMPVDCLLEIVGALERGGVVLVETTFDHTLEDPIRANTSAIRSLVEEFGNRMCVGAGTVLSVEEVFAAYDSGAQYIVAPNFNYKVVRAAKDLGLIVVPGAMTPTEIVSAYDSGADMIKLFPADDLGYHYIRNISAPLPHIPLLASGGVNIQTIPDFFRAGVQAVATGISILKPELVKARDWNAIETLARQHVDIVKDWQGS